MLPFLPVAHFTVLFYPLLYLLMPFLPVAQFTIAVFPWPFLPLPLLQSLLLPFTG